MCNSNVQKISSFVERYQILIGVIISSLIVSGTGIYFTWKYNEQQIKIEHIKLLASESPQARAFAYLSYSKTIDKDEIFDIMRVKYDNTCLLALDYMMDNENYINRVKSIISTLPIQIFLFTPSGQPPKCSNTLTKNFFNLLGFNAPIIGSSQGKIIPEKLEIRYFNDEDRFLAAIISKRFKSIIEHKQETQVVRVDEILAKRGTIEVWFPAE